jgi:hypothetical protein
MTVEGAPTVGSEHKNTTARVASFVGGTGTAPSCALVGSSSSLLQAAHGREIDAHDLVVRYNFAPSGGRFAAHVGARSDVRLMSKSWVWPDARHDGSLIAHAYALPMFGKEDREMNGAFNLVSIASDLIFAFGLVPPGRVPLVSAGMYGLLLALCTCGRVSMFGYDLDGKNPGQYFDDEREGIVPAVLRLVGEEPQRIKLAPNSVHLGKREMYARIRERSGSATGQPYLQMTRGNREGSLTAFITSGYREGTAHALSWERSTLRALVRAGCVRDAGLQNYS